MSTSGSGRDDRPLPLWPTPGPAGQPSAAPPPPPPPPPPTPSGPGDHDGWPDPPTPFWEPYRPAPRKRRNLPIVLGCAAAVVVLAAGAATVLLLTGHRTAAPATAAGAPAPSSAPATGSAAPSPATPSPATPSPAASGAPFGPGDCLEVTSSGSGALDNARLVRQDCSGAYFATVLSRATTKDACPEQSTVSRIQDGGQVLCLGQGDRGAIARPGDCVRVPTTYALPLIRTDCAASDRPFRLEAIVDDPTRCPDGTRAGTYSGYDRTLCVRFPS